jgi:hypothetical protein
LVRERGSDVVVALTSLVRRGCHNHVARRRSAPRWLVQLVQMACAGRSGDPRGAGRAAGAEQVEL